MSGKLVIGLLGGIGSGKSLVAEMLGRLGCAVVDADKLGHRLLERPDITAALAKRFGREILTSEGALGREELARRAFADAESLRALNAIMHGPLRGLIREELERLREGEAETIVLDAALLLETDWHELCDVLVFVDAELEKRRRRVARGRGWAPEELARRENLQKSLDIKRRTSDYVVGNNSSVSHLRRQVRLIYQQLTEEKRGLSGGS